MRAAILLLAAGVVAGGVLLLLLLDAGKEPARSPVPARARGDSQAAVPPEGIPAPPGGGSETLGGLRVVLQSGDSVAARDAAARLRSSWRTDPAARALAEQVLLDASAPSELRQAVALILGTIGASDPVLLQALAGCADDPALLRCVILALGATRDPPEDDDVFDLGERPWGQQGPGGLGITVRREIEDDDVRQALAACLLDDRAIAREAAAQALRHTTDSSEVRAAFTATLRAEADDDVAWVLGEALASWAGLHREAAEQLSIVNLLLARAGDEGLDAYRFRIENEFGRIPLDPAQVATLEELAHPARPYGVRTFALATLAASAPASARPLCERLLEGDADPAVRDLTARLLGTLPASPETIARLAAATREDTAWNVRWQAVDALGRFRDDPRAVEAIRAAKDDADARVAEHAAELAR